MNTLQVLGGVVGVSMFLATGAFAEILGTQPGTSSNPKDNVPKEIQRSTSGGETFGPGGSGPGTRSDALTGMRKEKPMKEGREELEANVDKTGGKAAMAAESLETKGSTSAEKKKLAQEDRSGAADLSGGRDRHLGPSHTKSGS